MAEQLIDQHPDGQPAPDASGELARIASETAKEEPRQTSNLLHSVVQGIPLPLVIVNLDFRIRTANEAFRAATRPAGADLDRYSLPVLASTLWGLDQPLRNQLERLRELPTAGEHFEFEHVTPGESPRVFCVRGCVLLPDGEPLLLVTLEDISSFKGVEREIRIEQERLTHEVEKRAKALGRSQEELRALTMSLFLSHEEECRQVARELHDDISQRLTAIEIDSDQVEKNIAGNADAKEGMRRVRARIAQLSEDVRSISHRLYPSIIEDLGLKPALESLADEFREHTQMIVTFTSQNVPDRLSHEVATVLYRIAQEALSNIGKHAGKTPARVSLRGTAEGIQLQVVDFGRGFTREDGARAGLGLLRMEERARHIGAILQIWSVLSEGTRVTVDVALDPAR